MLLTRSVNEAKTRVGPYAGPPSIQLRLGEEPMGLWPYDEIVPEPAATRPLVSEESCVYCGEALEASRQELGRKHVLGNDGKWLWHLEGSGESVWRTCPVCGWWSLRK